MTLKNNQILIICLFIASLGCASVKSPEGGPRDTQRPNLVKSTPTSQSTSFLESTISLEFSENVSEYNTKTQFLSPITPTTSITSGKKFRIKADSGFKLNTTYTLNLSKKIKDDHEGNLLKDTTLLFSTGDKIDSATLQVQINDLTGNPSSGSFTGTAKSENGTVFWSKTDSLKTLKIPGLKEGIYEVEIFQDKNENLKYDQDDGRIFFENLKTKNEKYNIRLLPQKSNPIKTFWLRKGDTCVLETDDRIIPDPELNSKIIGQNKDKTVFWLYPIKKTTLFSYSDSIRNCYNDTLKLENIDSTRSLKQIVIENGYECTQLRKETEIKWFSNWAIFRFPDSLEYSQDSIWQKTLVISDNPYGFRFNGQNLKAGVLKIRFDSLVLYNKKKINGDTLQLGKNDFEPPGNITGKLDSVEGKRTVLEIIDAKKNVVASGSNKTFSFFLKPGKYRIQVFEDLDGDGMYSGGNLRARRKAEPLYYYPSILDLKPGWDLENIRIKVEF